MKNLIKLCLIAVLLSWGTVCFAQTLGVTAGLNLSNMLMKDDDRTYSDDYDKTTGFHVGPTVEIPLNEVISFKSGLILSTKGFHLSDEGSSVDGPFEYELKLNLLYLDIPLTAKAAYDIGSTKIYGIMGPYVGFGLSGRAKSEFTVGGETEKDEEDIKFGSDEDKDDFKRFDYGLTVGAGIEFTAIEIGCAYSWGLANLAINTDNGRKIGHRVIAITFAYKLGDK